MYLFRLGFLCERNIHWYNVKLTVLPCKRDYLRNNHYAKDTAKIVLERMLGSKRYLDQEEKEHQWKVSLPTVQTS